MSNGDSDLRLQRRARRALVLIPIAMAVALTATVIVGYGNTRAVLRTIKAGQGQTYLQNLSRETRPGSAWTAETIQAAFEQEATSGLLCVVIFGRELEVLASAGVCPETEELSRQRLLEAPPNEIVERGEMIQMAAHMPPRRAAPGPPRDARLRSDRPPRRAGDRPPPRPRGAPRPRDGRRPPPPPPGRQPARPLPLLVIYEPLATVELEAGAMRTLGVGTAASLALVVIAIVFWRMSVRAERMQEEMERDRRLASLGEMSAVLAHEIRNPLASMKGHAQLLSEQLDEGSHLRGKADLVVREAIRLERLTSGLLSFVKTQRVDRTAVEPARLLRDAASVVDGDRLELDLEHAPDSWSLDADRIQQVLVNILRNALQASGDDGRAQARVVARGDELVFEIRDSGDGIAPGDEKKMFEAFHTTRVRGTGLGLAVARRIVELHGGRITAHNHSDGGAVFRVMIPKD